MMSSSRISKPSSRARATAGLTSAICILAAGDQAEAAQAERVRQLWPGRRLPSACTRIRRTNARAAGQADAWIRDGVARRPRVCGRARSGSTTTTTSRHATCSRPCLPSSSRSRARCDLPVIIHTREADDDTFRLLPDEGAGVGGVFHCFTGGVDRARRALDLGFHLSLAGIVTFPKATDLHEVAAFVPEDRLLVETDSPFLAPVPHRGKRNEPAWVRHVVEALARLRASSRAAMVERTTRNFTATLRAHMRPRALTPRAQVCCD